MGQPDGEGNLVLIYKTARQMITEATTPAKSASKPAGMACRVRFIPTEPK